MITVSQDEYIRMLNLLKYQAGFILSNVKVEEIKPDKEESKEFLRMLNDLDLTLTDYLNAKDKYILDDSYLEELNKTKKQLNDFVYGNWDVDRLIVDRQHHQGHC